MNGDDKSEDKQTFISLVPKVLESLCVTQAAPHDDTILHRLLDIIKLLITAPDDAHQAGLFTFIYTVKEKASELSSPVLVLALGVAAHLVSMTTLNEEDWEKVTGLFGVVQASFVADNSSVGAAYYSSLANVVCWSKGQKWLEKINIHMQTALSTLETGQSVFLLKAAEDFVLTTLEKNLQASSMLSDQKQPGVVVDTVQFLVNELTQIGTSRTGLMDEMIASQHVSAFHHSVAQVVKMLCQCQEFCQWKADDDKLLCTLALLAVTHSSKEIQLCALQSLIKLAAFVKDEHREELLMRKVLKPLLKLVSEGAIDVGVSVAAAFIHSSLSIADCGCMSTLQMLHQLPHDVLFGHNIAHPELTSLSLPVVASLCNQQKFGKIIGSIMHSLKRVANSDGLVRLVHTASRSKSDSDWLTAQSSWPQGTGAIVAGNQKLLNSLLHFLQEEDCPELTSLHCTAILRSLTQIMSRPMVESRLYSQVCSAFLSILKRLYQCVDPGEFAEMKEVLGSLATLLENRLVTLQWEIRDTSLELIRSMVDIVSDDWLCNLMSEHHLLCLVWLCTKDKESYPRASAITLVTSLTSKPGWWSALLQDANITEASLVDEMMGILTSDTEAFPRRAAVVFLTTFSHHHLTPLPTQSASAAPSHAAELRQRICSIVTSAMTDFDWEVKVKVLEFWEMLADLFRDRKQGCEDSSYQSVNNKENGSCETGAVSVNSNGGRPEYRKHKHEQTDEKGFCDKLNKLLQDGFGKALLAGAEDYDSAVKQKALTMLATVQETAEPITQVPAKSQKLSSKTSKSETSENLEDMPSLSAAGIDLSVETFLLEVSQLDPASQLRMLGTSSDEYDRNPASLLEDVLAAAKMAATPHEVTFMSEDEFEDADDMFIDCY